MAPQAEIVAVFLLALMLPLGYETTIAMIRRGYDLSGDQYVSSITHVGSFDAQTASVFNLVALAWFAILAICALCFRARPAVHKRLMLLATIQLLSASVTHLLGHAGVLSGPAVIAGFSLILLAAVGRDWLVERRVHSLTALLAVVSAVLLPIEATVIGPSAAWRHLIDWLAQSA